MLACSVAILEIGVFSMEKMPGIFSSERILRCQRRKKLKNSALAIAKLLADGADRTAGRRSRRKTAKNSG